jgi:hypothetical protein
MRPRQLPMGRQMVFESSWRSKQSGDKRRSNIRESYMKQFLLSLLAIGALHSADALTVDPSGTVQVAGSLVTAGGVLGGVNTSTEARISGGGAAFAQRLLVGIAGDSTPSIFYGPMPSTTLPTGTTGTAIGGGGVMTSGLLSIGDLNSGGLRGGRYSEADPNLYIMGGWLPGGAGQRAGLKFSTTPTTSPAPTANAITRMEITPDGYTTFYGPQPQAAQVSANETAVGGGLIRTNNVVISRNTPAGPTEAVRGDDPRLPIAFVRFTGATAAIASSNGIQSVVRTGVGSYTINLIPGIVSDGNYAIICTVSHAYGVTRSVNAGPTGMPTATSFAVDCGYGTASYDPAIYSIMVIR